MISRRNAHIKKLLDACWLVIQVIFGWVVIFFFWFLFACYLTKPDNQSMLEYIPKYYPEFLEYAKGVGLEMLSDLVYFCLRVLTFILLTLEPIIYHLFKASVKMWLTIVGVIRELDLCLAHLVAEFEQRNKPHTLLDLVRIELSCKLQLLLGKLEQLVGPIVTHCWVCTKILVFFGKIVGLFSRFLLWCFWSLLIPLTLFCIKYLVYFICWWSFLDYELLVSESISWAKNHPIQTFRIIEGYFNIQSWIFFLCTTKYYGSIIAGGSPQSYLGFIFIVFIVKMCMLAIKLIAPHLIRFELVPPTLNHEFLKFFFRRRLLPALILFWQILIGF